MRYKSRKRIRLKVSKVAIYTWRHLKGSFETRYKDEIRQEIADIFIYLLRLADKLDIDIEDAVREKIKINAKKYPVDLAKGNATKYNKRNA